MINAFRTVESRDCSDDEEGTDFRRYPVFGSWDWLSLLLIDEVRYSFIILASFDFICL